MARGAGADSARSSPAELIDPTIEPERLLYRLFHEHGVRVFPGVHVADECSCSRDRIRGILEGFSAEEIVESTEDGKISVDCEFCSKAYEFDPVGVFDGELTSAFPLPPDLSKGGEVACEASRCGAYAPTRSAYSLISPSYASIGGSAS